MSGQIDLSIMSNALLEQAGILDLLAIEGLTEVAINQPNRIWYDKGNGWEYKDDSNITYDLCSKLANTLAVYSNLPQLEESNPIASVVLPNGERGQIIIPPACENRTVSLTIRKPSLTRFSLESYRDSGRLSNFKGSLGRSAALTPIQQELLDYKLSGDGYNFLKRAVENKLNIIIVGQTNSGKTTIMKSLIDKYPILARIFTIEDTPEVSLPLHPNHVHLFFKEGRVTPIQLVKACMRMRPDHIFLAELRGDEAWNYLEALNTGHVGSITTIHANDCETSFARLAGLIKASPVGMGLDYDLIMRTIKSTIDAVCFFDRTYMTELYYNPQEKNNLLCQI